MRFILGIILMRMFPSKMSLLVECVPGYLFFGVSFPGVMFVMFVMFVISRLTKLLPSRTG